MHKPIFASVTDEICRCGYLQEQADDPRSAIVFDRELNEYNYVYPCAPGDGDCEGATSMLRIYHCPFCGGAAPESKRDLLFAVITAEEEERLTELLRGIRSLDDAVRMLGPPDRDEPHAITQRMPEKSGKPPAIESFRMLVYSELSETAEVWITDYRERGLSVRLQGKCIGLPRESGD